MKKHQLKAIYVLTILIFICCNSNAQDWSLTGNAGTDPTVNFLGTTDNKALVFRTNSNEQVRITEDNKVGIGISAPLQKLHVNGNINLDSGFAVFMQNHRVLTVDSGRSNIFLGNATGFSNITGLDNLFIGRNAGRSNTTGNTNIFLGVSAGEFSSTGDGNLFFGDYAGYHNTSGSYNAFFGYRAGTANTTGAGNLLFGLDAGLSNTTGTYNSFFGSYAGYNNSDGNNNTYVGLEAGRKNKKGSENTSVGNHAGYNNTGSSNTFIGSNANTNSIKWTNATAIGANSFVGINDALVLGSIAGINGATKSVNVGIGISTPTSSLTIFGQGNTSATSSLSIKNSFAESLLFARDDGKIGIGTITPSAGLHVTNGTEASLATGGYFIMGDTASANIVMDNNEIQARNNGAKATLFLNPADGLVSIGDDLDVNGDSISIGSAERLTDAGSNEVGTNSHFIPLADNTRSLGSSTNRWIDVWAVDGTINTSDARDKKNIRDLNYGLNDVMKLHPIKFNWKTGDDPNDKLGLIAQELQKVIPEVVRDYEFKTDEATGKNQKVASERMGVMYADLIPVLISAIQQQQNAIHQQQKEIEELKAMMNQNQSVTNARQSFNSSSVRLTSAMLEQNVPNPLKNTTSIRYTIPSNATSAQLIISDVSGRAIKQIELTKADAGIINIDASALNGGTYNYSLVIDGKIIVTKRMIISR